MNELFSISNHNKNLLTNLAKNKGKIPEELIHNAINVFVENNPDFFKNNINQKMFEKTLYAIFLNIYKSDIEFKLEDFAIGVLKYFETNKELYFDIQDKKNLNQTQKGVLFGNMLYVIKMQVEKLGKISNQDELENILRSSIYEYIEKDTNNNTLIYMYEKGLIELIPIFKIILSEFSIKNEKGNIIKSIGCFKVGKILDKIYNENGTEKTNFTSIKDNYQSTVFRFKEDISGILDDNK